MVELRIQVKIPTSAPQKQESRVGVRIPAFNLAEGAVVWYMH